MSVKTPRPVTDNEFAFVSHVAPDLTADGFYNAHQLEDRRRWLNGLPLVSRAAVMPLANARVRIEIPKARRFIRECCYRIPTVNRLLISHVLSQEAAHWLSAQPGVESPYVSNGAFIAGAILEGYPISIEGPSAYFPLDLTPEYKRLRQLRLDMESEAAETLARKIMERKARSA